MLSNIIYIDPGSGSIFIQLLIAFISGILVFYNSFRIRIISFFKKLFKKND